MHEAYDLEVLGKPGLDGQSPGPVLGIVGGGQLARMTAMAALQLGCNVVVLERNPRSPAATLATHSLVGDWNRIEELQRLAAFADVITLENEFLDAQLMARLEEQGHVVRPGAACLRLVQDKLVQKQTLTAAGLPVPRFRAVASPGEILEAARELGWPLVLKTRRNGYDGKGNALLRSAADTDAGWRKLGGGENALYVEAFCPFQSELAVIITRAPGGESVAYPLVQSVQRDHVCHEVWAPAPVPVGAQDRALRAARAAVAAVGGVGSFGVEMFLMPGGEVLVNELAPRVHNSGHYTIEACLCSQFENHVRAVLGWPLGAGEMVAPAAAMVNLLGDQKAAGVPRGLDRSLSVRGAHVHLYGKLVSGPGRKMGHVTALGWTLAEALATARRAAAEISFGKRS